MCNLIDSKFHIGDEIWYVNGNAITRGIIGQVTYGYNDKQVRYKLRKNESERYKGTILENRVFDSEESAKAFLASHPIKKIERESELLFAIESYIDLGENVKKPLLIQLCGGWGRSEVSEYLRKKYNPLGVDGHPFKRGHVHFINEKGETELISAHPELTTNFFPPAGFDYSKQPLFFMHWTSHDLIWNPAYYLECVQILKIPFVYFEPYSWTGGDYTHLEHYSGPAPEILSDFETILYAPTVNG